MDVLGSAGQVELNLFRTQFDEGTQTRALASGLRVVSASDDPSGLAIAENIQTKVLGLQQGIQNVQTAGNLLNVADGTLQTVQAILTRIHSLIVEASSDLNSTDQLNSIQTEIDQLMQEVNKISSGTQFNGISLLDGSHTGAGSPGLTTQGSVAQINPSLNPDGTIPTQNVAAQSGPGGAPGPLISNAYYQDAGFVPGMIEVEVTGYSANPVDPTTGLALGSPGVYVKVIQYSTNSGFNGAGGATEQVYTQAVPVGAGLDVGTGMPMFFSNANGTANMLRFDLANLSPQDVGKAMAFETYSSTDPSGAPPGTPLQVNTSGNEGGDVQINLPDVSTNTLGISDITVLAPKEVDGYNNPIGGDGSNQFATMDAETRVQNAIVTISGARAQIGAQTVALQEDANDAGIDVVNQTASESAIRDVNVADAASQLTKDQVLSQIGISVLAQMQSDAKLVVELVSGANPLTTGKI